MSCMTIWVEGQREPRSTCESPLVMVPTATYLCTSFLEGWWILTCGLSSYLVKAHEPLLLIWSPTLAMISTQHCIPPRSDCGFILFSSLGSTSGGPLPLCHPPPSQVLSHLWVPFKTTSGVLPRNSRSKGSGSISWDFSSSNLLNSVMVACRMVQRCRHTSISLHLENKGCHEPLLPLIIPTLGLRGLRA